MDSSTDFRSFLPGMYPVAALLVIVPIVDLIGLGWPLRPAETAWRFGSLGLGFGAMTAQILGVALAMFTAASLSHRRVLRLISLVTLAVATVMIAGIARFLLDYGQLRAAMPLAERADFDTSTFRALISATLGVPVLFALGARGLSLTRPAAPDVPVERPDEGPPHVIPFRQRQPH